MRTLPIIDAVVARLKIKLPHLAVEYFPEKPADYRLNHARGALLLSYAGSQFAETVDVRYVCQPQTLKLSITVIVRQLNGRGGAVDVLDALRLSIIGYKPPNCRRKIWALSEKFLGENAGLWQYALDIATETMLMEDSDLDTEVSLRKITHQETDIEKEAR